jgi:hypothetical protein
MSLRTQIHHAIDEVAPPVPTLEGRVKNFVLGDDDARKHLRSRPRSPWTRRFRGTLTLVAAALALTLVAGLFIGGRIWRTENQPPPTISQAQLKRLEAKPLQLSALAPEATCPVTPKTLNQKYGMVTGAGPVYVTDLEIFEKSDWGEWVSITFAYDERAPGLVLVRAIDLKGEGQVAFAQYPLAPTGVTAVGSTLGRAQAVSHNLLLRSEAAFQDRGHTPAINNLGQRPELIVLVGVQRGGSSCVGLQVDGPAVSPSGFSETIVL